MLEISHQMHQHMFSLRTICIRSVDEQLLNVSKRACARLYIEDDTTQSHELKRSSLWMSQVIYDTRCVCWLSHRRSHVTCSQTFFASSKRQRPFELSYFLYTPFQFSFLNNTYVPMTFGYTVFDFSQQPHVVPVRCFSFSHGVARV